MNKLLSILFAGLFAVASTAALAQDKKAEPKKEEAKPAAAAPAKKEEAKPAAKAEAKKEEPKKKEKKGGC
jgi:Ni/Co efflux regulator RcnB